MTSSLVGSEMCIRDRTLPLAPTKEWQLWFAGARLGVTVLGATFGEGAQTCLLYTSDAADDM
eukprot:6677284-Prorocentrum_lima.AAC.1